MIQKIRLHFIFIFEDCNLYVLVNTNVERNTKNLVASVRSRYESHPRIIKPILDSIEGISQDFLDLLETAGDSLDIRAMEELIDYNHGLLKTLGVSHPALENVTRICASFGKRKIFYNTTFIEL